MRLKIQTGSDVLCANRKCEYYSQCVPKNNQSVCECPICDNEFEPICGSDGITYENQCKLELESCRSKKDIRTLYTGLCGNTIILFAANFIIDIYI